MLSAENLVKREQESEAIVEREIENVNHTSKGNLPPYRVR